MTRQCQCGGTIRQHDLTGAREAWHCDSCGRHEVVSRTDEAAFEQWFARAAMAAIQGAAPGDYVWDLRNCEQWRRMHSAGMTPADAVDATFRPGLFQ